MGKLHVLHLEDNDSDAFFIQRTLENEGFDLKIARAASTPEFVETLETSNPDLILLDHGLSNTNSGQALELARQKRPGVPVIILSRSGTREQVRAGLNAGASDYVLKDQLWQLSAAVHRLQHQSKVVPAPPPDHIDPQAARRLLSVVQELSMARNLERIMEIVRVAARELTGADGATFVLREKDLCYYAEENAISPLWKGRRFPLSTCISGWVMEHHQSVAIENIYTDSRIPSDAYRPTFVKSLLMVPIRTNSPLGAIGNYWATHHLATASERELLEALANTTAVAMENVQVYAELERRVGERTAQLETANRELQAFSYSVSHDLRSPLCGIGGYTELLAHKLTDTNDPLVRTYLDSVRHEVRRMSNLIEDMIRLSRFTQLDLRREEVDLTAMGEKLATRLQMNSPHAPVKFRVQAEMRANADPGLIQIALDNLFSNAWKYSAKQPDAQVEFGMKKEAGGPAVFFIRDNGAGFDMRYATKLFMPFQRMHSEEEFQGTGIGLATVQRIIVRHGGRIWAEAEEGKGATFYFTLPEPAT